MEEEHKTVWLIELIRSGVPHWMAVSYDPNSPGLYWTDDAQLAIWFARQKDAESLRFLYGFEYASVTFEYASVTEHIFL